MDEAQQITLGDTLVLHWKSLVRGDDLPKSSDFKPEKSLKDLLPHIFLLELEDGDITLSLVGPGHDERLSVNTMGVSYLDTMPPERRYPTLLRFQTMLMSQCGCRALVDEEMSDGRISPSILTAVPFAADEKRKPCVVAIVPPSTLVAELGQPVVPFMSRPFQDFSYLDLGFGQPPQLGEALLGIGQSPEDNIWPDLASVVKQT